MGEYVDDFTADGRAFKRWKPTREGEFMPSNTDYCLVCGAVPYWRSSTDAKGDTISRSYIDHDPKLHDVKRDDDDERPRRREPDVKAIQRAYDGDDDE